MTINKPVYATREMVKRALDIKETARANEQIDRLLEASARSIDGCLHRTFYPRIRTLSLSSWNSWLNDNELISVISLSYGGSAIADYTLLPSSGPPYNRIEIEGSGSFSFSVGDTISLVGLFGYTLDLQTIGTLPVGLNAGTETLIVPHGARIGVGDLVKIDDEYMIVYERGWIDSTQNLQGALTASLGNTTLPVGADIVNDGFEDGTLLPFTTGGTVGWSVQSAVVHSGLNAARSGVISHSQQSDLTLAAAYSGVGTISFSLKVSSETNFDFLKFFIDGIEKARWSGEMDWSTVSYAVASGAHTFLWRYVKDSAASVGSDAAWIDDVVATDSTVSAPGVFVGETILVDAEKMLIVDVAGTNIMVKRAWDGSVLSDHTAGTDVYASRSLSVLRGSVGSVAVAHSVGASIKRWVPPILLTQLNIAETLTGIEQEQSAYARVVGSGDNTFEAKGVGLTDLRDRALTTHGRKNRVRSV